MDKYETAVFFAIAFMIAFVVAVILANRLLDRIHELTVLNIKLKRRVALLESQQPNGGAG
jgi:hypothetical protein